jgi:hypothetical protein
MTKRLNTLAEFPKGQIGAAKAQKKESPHQKNAGFEM